MGVTKIRHTYANPFLSRGANIYPQGYSFEAGTGAVLDANQPYANIPYKASFSGCCRLGANSNDPNANDPYRLETFVDLTDRDNAAASRSLPIITVSKITDYFYVLARDQYMKSSDNPISMSGGNTNYPVDDYSTNTTALKYYVAQSKDLGFTTESYTPWSAVTVDPVSGKVSFSTLPAAGLYQLTVAVKSSSSMTCTDRSSSSCECMTTGSGCSKTVIDFMVQIVAAASPIPSICNLSAADDVGYNKLMGWVGYFMSVPICVSATSPTSNIVLNYVFSGLSVEASSLGVNAAGETGVVTYSAGELNGQGLPEGAFLYSSAPNAIVDIAFTYDNPFDAHRPGHDWAVNKLQRDYANAPGAQQLWDSGYRPVIRSGKSFSDIDTNRLSSTLSFGAFDFNSGTGGAAVYMWLKRSSTEAAITNLNLSTCVDQEHTLANQNFVKIPMNLNEQAETSVPAIYLWYKRGSGSPIVEIKPRDVSVESDCSACTSDTDPNMINLGTCSQSKACNICVYPDFPGDTFQLVPGDANEGTLNRKILIYFLKARQQNLHRSLQWTPQVPGHYIFCFAGTDTSANCPGPAACSSVQRCIDMNVTADPAPMFVCGSHCALSTYMGQMLHFNVSFLDIPHPDEAVAISVYTQGLTLDGAVPMGGAVIAPVGGLWQTSQLMGWFPEAAYGGFSGMVCFNGRDRSGAYRLEQNSVGCLMVTVARCTWFVQSEDSLIQIAARFSTNWLQVWHFNPTLLHPDDSLVPQSLLNIGHLYQVEPNDALSVLADRFGTSIRHIQMNNWDLTNITHSGLPVGKEICIIPSSCKTAANVVRV
jgi:hypothetical protein